MSPRLRAALRVQALYYGLTGVWPFLHYASFEAVTGPKTDDWLVLTVGAMLVPTAAALWLAAREQALHAATIALMLGMPLAFIGIEVVFVMRGTIGPVYLLDAGAQALLFVVLAALVAASRRTP